MAGVPGAVMNVVLSPVCPHHIDRPVMRQWWRDLLFVHGRVDANVIRRLLPAGVEVDEFDGSGWVSYVPFGMHDIAFAGTPPVPYLGTFPEVNIRTYVRHEGVPYVWFFSLDIPRFLPVAVARSVFALPYMYSAVHHGRIGSIVTSSTKRRWSDAAAHSVARIGDVADTDDLDVFLTARWGLLTATRRSLVEARIHHEPWVLHDAELLEFDERLSAAARLPDWEPERVTYAPGLPVTVGAPRRVRPLTER